MLNLLAQEPPCAQERRAGRGQCNATVVPAAELEAGRVAYRRDHLVDVARVEAVVDRASLVATQ